MVEGAPHSGMGHEAAVWIGPERASSLSQQLFPVGVTLSGE